MKINVVDLSSAKPSPEGEGWVTTARMQEVEQRREQLPRGNQNKEESLFNPPHPNLLPQGEGVRTSTALSMKMKRLQPALILLCILCGFSAFAEESLVKPQIQGEVEFVSGGVGGDEQKEMQTIRAGYNLHLLFSIKGTGEYLSDVKVRIADSNGNTVMESLSDGPMLFAKLKPGRYTLAVERDGQVIRKTATIKGNRKVSLSFTWPEQEED